MNLLRTITISIIALAMMTQIGWAQRFAGECAHDHLDLSKQTTIALDPTTQAQFDTQGETTTLRITGATQQAFAFETYWQPDRIPEQITIADVNNDGRFDIFVGIGFGMVNADYTLLLSGPDGTWREAGYYTDPSFCQTNAGFTGAARSGPRWFTTYFRIDGDGLPYRHIEQAIVGDIMIDRRRTFDAAGQIIEDTVVWSGQSLFEPAAPVTAKILDDAGAALINPDDNQPLTTLPSGTPVTVLASDDTFSTFLVQTSTGLTGRVQVDQISTD